MTGGLLLGPHFGVQGFLAVVLGSFGGGDTPDPNQPRLVHFFFTKLVSVYYSVSWLPSSVFQVLAF